MTRENLGVPVIAIGVPTVVGAAAIVHGTVNALVRTLTASKEGSRYGEYIRELDSDSAVTFLGMLLGAALAHNFNLVGAAAKAATETEAAVLGGPAMPGKIAVIVCIALLFVIAAANMKRRKK